MKATFHKHPKSFNELRESLAVALVHSGWASRDSGADRAACRLAETDDASSSAATDAAFYVWRCVDTASASEKRALEKDFWRAAHDLIHDFACDAEISRSWDDANSFAEFCERHADKSSHNF